MTVTFDDVKVNGALDVTAGTVRGGWARSDFTQESLKAYPLNFIDFRVWDALQTNLGSTGAGDDLGIAGGTWGTDAIYLTTQDLKTAGATSEHARTMWGLPVEYVAGETVNIRASAGMITTVADTSATVDFSMYKFNRDAAITGSDLIETAATSCNSLTFANYDFTVTATSLNPGDILDIRVTLTVTDSASGTAVIARIGAIEMLLDIKG